MNNSRIKRRNAVCSKKNHYDTHKVIERPVTLEPSYMKNKERKINFEAIELSVIGSTNKPFTYSKKKLKNSIKSVRAALKRNARLIQ